MSPGQQRQRQRQRQRQLQLSPIINRNNVSHSASGVAANNISPSHAKAILQVWRILCTTLLLFLVSWQTYNVVVFDGDDKDGNGDYGERFGKGLALSSQSVRPDGLPALQSNAGAGPGDMDKMTSDGTRVGSAIEQLRVGSTDAEDMKFDAFLERYRDDDGGGEQRESLAFVDKDDQIPYRREPPSSVAPANSLSAPDAPATAHSMIRFSTANILWTKNWHNLMFANSSYHDLHYSMNSGYENYFEAYTEHLATVDELWHHVNLTSTLQHQQRNEPILIWIRTSSNPVKNDVATFIRHVLPDLRQQFRLVSTDGDNSMPHALQKNNVTDDDGNDLVQQLLTNPNLIAWYTQNYRFYRPHRNNDNYDNSWRKVRPIPIGFDLHSFYQGHAEDNPRAKVRQMVQFRNRAKRNRVDTHRYQHFLNASSSTDYKTNPDDRHFHMPLRPWYDTSRHPTRTQLHDELSHCTINSFFFEPIHQLWSRYSQYTFGIAPRGNGLDTHRLWEMLFLEMIPITQSSSAGSSGVMGGLFHNLPVIVVKEWKDVCQEGFLEGKVREFLEREILPVNEEVFLMEYWIPPMT